LYDFYDERLPDDVFTASRLKAWLKETTGADTALRIEQGALLARDPGAELGEQFPDYLQWEDMRYRLSYHFEPGNASDGVSVTVPVALLNRVPRFRFDWLVPGLLREKCIALVKALPKQQRKHLVPAPDFVDRALAELEPDNVDLIEALTRVMSRLGGTSLNRSDWAPDKLDDYYRMNIRVVDGGGRLLAQNRNLDALIRRFRDETQQSVTVVPDDSPRRTGISRWDMDAIPREWRFRQAGVAIVSYPALVDCGDNAAIELFDYPEEARQQHRLGVLRLAQLQNSQGSRFLRKQMLRGNNFTLVLAGAGLERAALLDDLVAAAFAQALQLEESLPFTRAQFDCAVSEGGGRLVTIGNDLETLLFNTLEVLAATRQLLAGMPAGAWSDSRDDIKMQLADLLQAGFMRDTPAAWLAQYPRYMKALRTRVERLSGQYPKDQQHMAMLAGLTEPLQAVLAERPGLLLACPAACQYRWALEEFRVSLFAQNLGTKIPVSLKRLQAQWLDVQQWLQNNPH
jgi:ATP-dependent helicase HrpA